MRRRGPREPVRRVPAVGQARPPAPPVTDSLWRRLADLVPEALDCSGDARDAYLRDACRTPDGAPDPALLAEARALIRASETADATGALLSPVAGSAGAVARDARIAPLRLPERIGPWRIGGLLGEGGMGVVYRAHRDDGAFRREVAIKRLRPGLGPRLAERLRAESRILARLDHPGIARLHDSGVDEHGAPYLVMECVAGETVTAYADREALGVRARVRLGLAVAEAVAYAHRHLVVHRDVKPSNVLVEGARPDAGDDAGPRVKLLDFGLAKLLAPDADPLLSVPGVMTPAYAAPEQIRGGAVTSATDVYALGMLLFELLAGRRPYELAGASPAEAERIVCEAAPPPPSAVAPTERAREIRGDLDGVVLRALLKDPARRYASAEGLADDLRRVLDGRPVEARPATLGYLASRFVRRHRLAVAAAAGVVLAAAALVAAHTVSLQRERDRALAAEARAADQAERAEAVAGFLEGILRAPNPAWYVDAETKGPDTPIRAVLDEAAARVERDFADRPDLRADLRHVLGDTYLGLGMDEEARAHHLAVLSIREQLYTPPHPALAEALYYAGGVARTPAERVALYEQAAAMLRARPGGNNLPFILTSLASHYSQAGFPEIAGARAREAHAFVDTSFVSGADGHRYRASSLRAAAQLAAEARLDLGDVEGAGVWVRELPPPYARSEACTVGRLLAATGDAEGAVAHTRACWADAEEGYRDAAAADLVAIYEARPDLGSAAPYRAAAARVAAARDSVRRALRPWVVAQRPGAWPGATAPAGARARR